MTNPVPTRPARPILMVAFHYPPFQGSSSTQRTLAFLRHLPQLGWRPTLLTVDPRAYPRKAPAAAGTSPDPPEVHRALALDSSRHLAIRGRYARWTALPDRWVSWLVTGLAVGLRLVRQERPVAIWSTYPIATCHLIGVALAGLSGLPWVADFRDPMVDDGYPADRATRWAHERIERWTVRRARRVVFTTAGARDQCARRYPDLPGTRWAVLENGYEEEEFRCAEREVSSRSPGGPIRIVHSGTLYRSERDPRPFFEALATLKRAGRVDAGALQIVLRASGDENYHGNHLEQLGLRDMVSLAPAVGYVEALGEMLHADGLLLFQAANCNRQIPAKVYEYFRARRPILALTDPAGDTARLLCDRGLGMVARIDSTQDIAEKLSRFVGGLHQGNLTVPDSAEVERHSRAARAREFAALLEAIVGEKPAVAGRS